MPLEGSRMRFKGLGVHLGVYPPFSAPPVVVLGLVTPGEDKGGWAGVCFGWKIWPGSSGLLAKPFAPSFAPGPLFLGSPKKTS